jgi:hypothetical protein
MNVDGRMVFVKEAEGAMVPVLMEKFGSEHADPPAVRANRAGARREVGAPAHGDK